MTRRKRGARRADVSVGSVVFTVALGILLAVAAFAIDAWGGQWIVPSWEELFDRLGVSLELPDAEVLAQGDATVSFLDVGQGDCVLIASEGQYCLIDAGTPDSADALVSMLHAAGVRRLELLVMSHPHSDHIGGMDEVLENFEVGTLLLPDLSASDTESGNLGRVLQAAEEAGTGTLWAEDGQTFSIGAGQLQILLAGVRPADPDDLNNSSLCMMYTMGRFSFLTTGDAEKEAERALAQVGGFSLQATLFKAGHHGSSTSNTDELLALASPELAVISCGLNNDYGHPHAEVLDRFGQYGVDVYRTDLQGTVTVCASADGSWQVLDAVDAEPMSPAA